MFIFFENAMKKIGLIVGLLAAMIYLLSGCSASKKARAPQLTVTPAPYVLYPDTVDHALLDMTFTVPAKRFKKRSRLIVSPYLVWNDTMRQDYDPWAFDRKIYAQKNQRKEVLENYVDTVKPYSMLLEGGYRSLFVVPVDDTLPLPPAMDSGVVYARILVDGCGNCAGIDTIELAYFRNPITLLPPIEDSLKLEWIDPEFIIRPKLHEKRGVASLQFVINRSDINLEMGNNRAEMEGMLNLLQTILQDSLASIQEIHINGLASADGPLAFNTRLARNRALSALRWIQTHLDLPDSIEDNIHIGSRPEGWQPVLAAMQADTAAWADTAAFAEILRVYADTNDDVQEKHIRALPFWDAIKDKYLQKDRKVEYIYSYRIRSFITDEELLAMYSQRPDAFNEEEFLRVSTLMETDSLKKGVYSTIVFYFPQSEVAANNLGVLWLREGEQDSAIAVLQRHKLYLPEALNTLAASYVYKGEYERAIELLYDIPLPQARYNLGLIKAKMRQLGEAYALLSPFRDLNTAIVALSVNQTARAGAIMQILDDTSALAEYVRALVAARAQDRDSFYEHLRSSCSVDAGLRQRAVSEPDFWPYSGDVEFRRILGIPDTVSFELDIYREQSLTPSPMELLPSSADLETGKAVMDSDARHVVPQKESDKVLPEPGQSGKEGEELQQEAGKEAEDNE